MHMSEIFDNTKEEKNLFAFPLHSGWKTLIIVFAFALSRAQQVTLAIVLSTTYFLKRKTKEIIVDGTSEDIEHSEKEEVDDNSFASANSEDLFSSISVNPSLEPFDESNMSHPSEIDGGDYNKSNDLSDSKDLTDSVDKNISYDNSSDRGDNTDSETVFHKNMSQRDHNDFENNKATNSLLQTSSGLSLLHLYAANSDWDELITTILSAINKQDQSLTDARKNLAHLSKLLTTRKGPTEWTPLMMSCVTAPTEVVALLLQSCPASCIVPDKSGSLPIHLVCSWRRSKSKAVSFQNNDDADIEAPEEYDADVRYVIGMLLRTSSDSLCVKNRWGQTPLHSLFVGTGTPPSKGVVRVVLGLHDPLLELEEREAERRRIAKLHGHDNESCDTDEDVSLVVGEDIDEDEGEVGSEIGKDIDCLGKDETYEWNSEEKALRLSKWKKVKRAARKALATKDYLGRLPLHAAAAAGMDEDILRLLIDVYPEAATVTTPKGDLPVHLLHNWALGFAKHEIESKEEDEDENEYDYAQNGRMKKVHSNIQYLQIRKQMYHYVSAGSIEALLEPLCVGFKSHKFFWDTSIASNEIRVVATTSQRSESRPKINLTPEFRLKKIQSILRTTGRTASGGMEVISEQDEDDTDTTASQQIDDSFDVNDKGDQHNSSFDDSMTEILSTSTSQELQSKSDRFALSALAAAAAAEAACRLPGSYSAETIERNLPLHIACEHGVSLKILEALCEQYPEGVGIPRVIVKNSWQYTKQDNDEKNNGNESKDNIGTVYPLEIFECGRAGIEATTIATGTRRRLSHFATLLQEFVERSDLLFSYFPQAIPSQYHPLDLNDETDVSEKKVTRLYRHDPDRITRLENHIRSEAMDSTKFELGVTARLAWFWFCGYDYGGLSINCKSQGDYEEHLFSSVGRILVNLGSSALRKLRFIDTNSIRTRRQKVLLHMDSISNIQSNPPSVSSSSSSSTSLLLSENDLNNFKINNSTIKIIVLPNGRTVQEEADIRAAKTTMEEMLCIVPSCGIIEEEKSPIRLNWQYFLMKYLGYQDALNYSATCRRARAAGVRLLPYLNPSETSRSWSLRARSFDLNEGDEQTIHKKILDAAEYWQDLDNVMVSPNFNCRVFLTYLLDINENSNRSGSRIENKNGNPGINAGLLVASLNKSNNVVNTDFRRRKLSQMWKIEIMKQNVVGTHLSYNTSLNSDNSTKMYQVRLSFQYNPECSYRLAIYGPPHGGSVSVSNMKVRQLLYSYNELGCTPLHAMLRGRYDDYFPNRNLPLEEQVTLLLEAGFGSKSIMGDGPVHFALKCNAPVRVLNALITSNPSSLIETDKDGHTPLHTVFLLSRNEPPPVSVIEALLSTSTPGENAARLRDSSNRLPLHIAAERGAGIAILSLLVNAYKDGCYRQNRDGDLPVHLLVKSGAASTASVELLLEPIADSDTICRVPGSGGVELPLHIAADYNCCYDILERLLATYPEAGTIPRKKSKDNGEAGVPLYPLDILETWRDKVAESAVSEAESMRRALDTYDFVGVQEEEKTEITAITDSEDAESISVAKKLKNYNPSISRYLTDSQLSEYNELYRLNTNKTTNALTMESALMEITLADFDLRSDLLFVHNPHLTKQPPGIGVIPIQYRKDLKRIQRLEAMIRREAIQCVERLKLNNKGNLTETARLAWCFMCTFRNPADSMDNYSKSVARILKSLSNHAVQLLADITNPKSSPVPNIPIRECATPTCRQLITSKIQFVGRYFLETEGSLTIHKSDSCLVIRAIDYGAVEAYENVMKIFQKAEELDIDDLKSIATISIEGTINSPDHNATEPLALFSKFAQKIGVKVETATKHILELMDAQNTARSDDLYSISELSYTESGRHKEYANENQRQSREVINVDAFREFCNFHCIDSSGVRNVVLKLMVHRPQFLREKECRICLNKAFPSFSNSVYVSPILEDYDVDRIEEASVDKVPDTRGDDDISHFTLSESKDKLFSMDIHEKNDSIHNYSLYKYALVMQKGDRDLTEIFLHEKLGILEIRQITKQIAEAIQKLHKCSIVHGDIKMENIVRFGSQYTLIDLDNAIFLKDDLNTQLIESEKIVCGSHKFNSGILPPEMITRFDLIHNPLDLQNYETYWKPVANDAREFSLLTPDDIQTITNVINNLSSKSEETKFTGTDPNSIRVFMNEPLTGLEELSENWKEKFSLALVSINFEDLPSTLNSCKTLDEFEKVWNRLQMSAQLWEKVKPRKSKDCRYAYVIKYYDDLSTSRRNVKKLPSNDRYESTSLLSLNLMIYTEKIDIWAFGLLLFTLCSGGSLFQQSFSGELQNASDYEMLFGWNTDLAHEVISSRINDPLAMDLLKKLLQKENDRLESMDLVLAHPFFGPPLSHEAQKILERYEEHQLVLEGSVAISKLSNESREKFNLSLEKQCKIVFDVENIVVPTSIFVLPFELSWNQSSAFLEMPQDPRSIGVAVATGRHLLDMNKITAKLSFWLKLKEKMLKNKKDFKPRIKAWLRRARTEKSEILANEIVEYIGFSTKYNTIVQEMLDEDDMMSNARAYIRQPIETAYFLMQKSISGIFKCYSTFFFYLVDEYCGCPILDKSDINKVYPIESEIDYDSFQNIYLPFINMLTMTRLATDGLNGLTKLLGMPSSLGIPDLWKHSTIGLIHDSSDSSSISEFAILQDAIRRYEPTSNMKDSLVGHGSPKMKLTEDAAFWEQQFESDSSLFSESSFETGTQVRYLESFFRENDPTRSFCGLRRVYNEREQVAIWTTNKIVNQMQEDTELAQAESRMCELSALIEERKQLENEMSALSEHIKLVKMTQKDTKSDENSRTYYFDKSKSYQSDKEQLNSAISTSSKEKLINARDSSLRSIYIKKQSDSQNQNLMRKNRRNTERQFPGIGLKVR